MIDTTLSCGCDVSLGRSGLCSSVYKDSAWISQCRLHKAADELLEALKLAVESATPHVRVYHRAGEDCTELVEETTWDPWVEVARAAIAKAVGL